MYCCVKSTSLVVISTCGFSVMLSTCIDPFSFSVAVYEWLVIGHSIGVGPVNTSIVMCSVISTRIVNVYSSVVLFILVYDW